MSYHFNYSFEKLQEQFNTQFVKLISLSHYYEVSQFQIR